MYKSSLKNLEPGVALMIQDFSRNRDIYHNREVKSSWWTRKQITMHPTVIYFKDLQGNSNRIVITHMSDITLHDAHIVHYITKDCIEYIREHFPDIEWHKVIMWSDGCCSQYKGKKTFFYLNKLQNIFPELKIQRNYFGSEHGKGESDAETGIFSRQIKDAVKSEKTVLSNASQMCEFLRENNKGNRIFRIFTAADLKYIYDEFIGVSVATLKGNCTRSLHQIMPGKKTGLLLTRRFSCFCKSCTLDMYASCENKNFTLGKFKSRELPSNVKNDSSNDTNSENEEEDDDNVIHPNDGIFNDGDQIEIKQEKINICDLNENEFIITSLKKGKKLFYFVAQIQKVDNDSNKVVIDYLRQHNEHLDIFHKTEIDREINYEVGLEDIIMRLESPQEFRRGNKFFFTKKINLNVQKK